MSKILKPKTVLKKWNKLIEDMKPKRPGKKLAQEYAKMAGMRSIGEVRCAADLDDRKIKYIYEPFKIEYHLCEGWCKDCNVKTQKYTPDFYLPDYELLIEYKGKLTNVIRKQLVAIKRNLDGRQLCIVFERSINKLSSRPNSSRYWQWAEKSGFRWSDATVAEEWFD
jgi:hypothetical protein